MSQHLTRFGHAGLDPLDDLLRGFFVRPMDVPRQEPVPGIPMDVKEDERTYEVHAELPGVKKEDIHVHVEGNTVSIVAEVKQAREGREGERVLRAERYYGKVSRSFSLGQDIDDTQAVARFTDGVLVLTLPKRTVASARRLAID